METYCKNGIFTMIILAIEIALTVIIFRTDEGNYFLLYLIYAVYGIFIFAFIIVNDDEKRLKEYLKGGIFIVLLSITVIALIHPLFERRLLDNIKYEYVSYIFLSVFCIYSFYLTVRVSDKLRALLFAILTSVGLTVLVYLYNNLIRYLYWYPTYENNGYTDTYLDEISRNMHYTGVMGLFRYLLFAAAIFVICGVIIVICSRVRIHDLRNKTIIFCTHNQGKIQSANKYFDGLVKFETADYDITEIRGSIEEIATAKVKEAFGQTGRPTISMDAGFEIRALKNFPGSYVNHMLETIGIDGILKLMSDCDDRSCRFTQCLAYYDGLGEPLLFSGCHEGVLSTEKRGVLSEDDWSELSLIFIPAEEIEGGRRTLAELSHDERVELTRRDDSTNLSAFRAFKEWYISNYSKQVREPSADIE